MLDIWDCRIGHHITYGIASLVTISIHVLHIACVYYPSADPASGCVSDFALQFVVSLQYLQQGLDLRTYSAGGTTGCHVDAHAPRKAPGFDQRGRKKEAR